MTSSTPKDHNLIIRGPSLQSRNTGHMSLATIERAPLSTPTTAPAAAPAPAEPRRLHAVPQGTEARGFALYVGLDEFTALEAGTDLATVVDQLKKRLAELVPAAQTYATVALAPAGSGGRDVDVVRLALQDPAALAKHRQTDEPAPKPRGGVVIDISRKRVQLDGETAPLTYKEFELLQYLVLREGRTVDRAELISGLWSANSVTGSEEEIPNERTIDVHVRRLRSKLGDYEDIVRTVRGVGYRFDRHADVSIRQASTPSPDFF